MVTWLHFWIMSMLLMVLAVTDMVTNGYIGYIKNLAIISLQGRGRIQPAATLFL